MERQTKQRLAWVQLYLDSNDAGFVCRRRGISRPTLRKWVRRYEAEGVDGLRDQSKKPQSSPNTKITKQIESWIVKYRKQRNLGARRLQTELIRLHNCHLSLATIHKVLTRNAVKPLVKIRLKNHFKRYSRPIPGDRIQMDTCKIAPGLTLSPTMYH